MGNSRKKGAKMLNKTTLLTLMSAVILAACSSVNDPTPVDEAPSAITDVCTSPLPTLQPHSALLEVFIDSSLTALPRVIVVEREGKKISLVDNGRFPDKVPGDGIFSGMFISKKAADRCVPVVYSKNAKPFQKKPRQLVLKVALQQALPALPQRLTVDWTLEK
jgi:hypothetical protein